LQRTVVIEFDSVELERLIAAVDDKIAAELDA
jgi:hypothetical protein